MFSNCLQPKLGCDNCFFGDPPRLALVETCTNKTTADAIIIFSVLEKGQILMYYYLSLADNKQHSTLQTDCLDSF